MVARVRAFRAACAGVAATAVVVALAAGGGRNSAEQPGAFSAASLPEVPKVDDSAATPENDQAIPRASRSTIRSKGPHQLPPVLIPNSTCTLTLPQGDWKLDVVAARTLVMLTALAYHEERPVAKAARAFEHSLRLQYRFIPTPSQAREMLRRNEYKKGGLTPHTWAVDAVLALYSPRALTCAQPIRSMPAEPMLTNGLTMRAQTMIFAFFASYGGRPLGGFDPEGITSGHIENSAHYDGRAVDIFFSRDDSDNRARGWLLANWLVANADHYSIATVIFDDHVWTLVKSAEGWRPYVHPSGDRKNPTLRHLDHIHVDVVNGEPKETANAATEADNVAAEVPAPDSRAAAPSNPQRSTKVEQSKAPDRSAKPAEGKANDRAPAEPVKPAGEERKPLPRDVLAPPKLPKNNGPVKPGTQPGPPTE